MSWVNGRARRLSVECVYGNMEEQAGSNGAGLPSSFMKCHNRVGIARLGLPVGRHEAACAPLFEPTAIMSLGVVVLEHSDFVGYQEHGSDNVTLLRNLRTGSMSFS